MKRKIFTLVSVLLMLCLMSGCFFKRKERNAMDRIEGDIKCEFRVGKDADTIKDAVETDIVFDKDRFTDLFNEKSQYVPSSLKYKTGECSLKISASDQPEEWEKIHASEINIKALFGRQSRNVSVYEYDSRLYFFVLGIGGKSKPEEQGDYYMELSPEMTEYWKPILKDVREDAEQDHLKKYGSFTVDTSYSYDKEYSAEITEVGEALKIHIKDKDHNEICTLKPCRVSDFWGVCWDKDSYDLWIQSADIGVVCYSPENGKWVLNSGAVRPDHIISKYDK